MITRYTASFGASVGITFSLLLLMQILIASGPEAIVDTPPIVTPTLIKLPVDTPTQTEEKVEPPPPLEEQPERPETTTTESGDWAIGPTARPPKVVTKGPFPLFLDGKATLLVAPTPMFPPRMLSRGIEGYVIVQFTVTTEGSVTDVVVLESSHRGFEQAAIKAAQRMKYKPEVFNEIPRAVAGVMYKFSFKIEDS